MTETNDMEKFKSILKKVNKPKREINHIKYMFFVVKNN